MNRATGEYVKVRIKIIPKLLFIKPIALIVASRSDHATAKTYGGKKRGNSNNSLAGLAKGRFVLVRINAKLTPITVLMKAVKKEITRLFRIAFRVPGSMSVLKLSVLNELPIKMSKGRTIVIPKRITTNEVNILSAIVLPTLLDNS
jgi:hypothetical protein